MSPVEAKGSHASPGQNESSLVGFSSVNLLGVPRSLCCISQGGTASGTVNKIGI